MRHGIQYGAQLDQVPPVDDQKSSTMVFVQ